MAHHNKLAVLVAVEMAIQQAQQIQVAAVAADQMRLVPMEALVDRVLLS
jgi:hypothetical protein